MSKLFAEAAQFAGSKGPCYNEIMEWLNLVAGVAGVVLSIGGALLAAGTMLAKYREKVDKLEEHDKEYRKEIRQIATDVAVLGERIQNIQKSIDSFTQAAQSHSPIQLTDRGWKMVKDSGAYQIFEQNRDKYLAELEAQKPRSQYDVQEKAYRIMGNKFNANEFKPVEQWAFNNGKTMDEIIRILGYPLRDYYFEKHPEIVNPNEKY